MRLWFIKTIIKVMFPKPKMGQFDPITGKVIW